MRDVNILFTVIVTTVFVRQSQNLTWVMRIITFYIYVYTVIENFLDKLFFFVFT